MPSQDLNHIRVWDSAVGKASDWKAWHNTDAGSSPWCGKGFFSKSQLPVQTLLMCPQVPVGSRMHQHLCARKKSQRLAAGLVIERSWVRIPAGAAGDCSSPGSTFYADSFQYLFHPRVTTAARKRPWSFCRKCRWQVTAKHAYTLRMWLCMKWHGAWLYGVYRIYAETAAVSCGTSPASTVSTPLRWIFKKCAIKPVTHVEPHVSAVSLLKRAESSAT